MNIFKRVQYSPFLVQLVVIRRCNLSCGYCNEFDEVSDPVPFETLKKRIDAIQGLGAFAIEFTGGEPMMHPQIYELIAYARSLGTFKKVMMISNAYLFNEEKIQRLNESGLQELQVSVDGVQPNDVTVKVLKPMRKKLEVLARVAKFQVVLSGVVGSAPPEETLQVVHFAQEHKFRPRVLVLHGPDGQIKLSPEQLAAYEEIGRSMGRRFTEANDYRTKIMKTGSAPFKCRAGSRYIYVDEFGNACWCSQTRDVFSKPLLEYTRADLKEQFNTQKSCNPGCTLGCARTCSGYDEWRSQPTA